VYVSFFGLAENPFSLAPDPRYLFMGASHWDALAQLEARRGIAVLTGEAGTGKTSLLLALRDRLDADTAVAYVFNTTLSFEGIVEFLLEDLGIAKPEESPARRLAALNSFLSERERAGQSTTLIVDEAQNLDALTLAQLGRLASLESATTSKRLQILLVGPPELEARLDHPDLQHLRDSIRVRCRVRPLDADEVQQYIRNRLHVAGAPDTGLFSKRAIRRITQYSGGVPRVINMLSDHCLLFAYADHKRRVDRHITNRAIAYLENGSHAPRSVFPIDGAGSPGRLRRAQEIAGIALVSAAAAFALSLLSGRR
jgi:general secretion pathway protein A